MPQSALPQSEPSETKYINNNNKMRQIEWWVREGWHGGWGCVGVCRGADKLEARQLTHGGARLSQ